LKEQYLNYYGVNDHVAHQHGKIPLESVVEVDQKLQKVFQAFGNWDEALKIMSSSF